MFMSVWIFYGGKIMVYNRWVFNYPTLAEAYKVAALNGLNKLRLEPGTDRPHPAGWDSVEYRGIGGVTCADPRGVRSSEPPAPPAAVPSNQTTQSATVRKRWNSPSVRRHAGARAVSH